MIQNTRPMPPWVPSDYVISTFLEKTIRRRYGLVAPTPSVVLNVNVARQTYFIVPSQEWSSTNE